MELTRNCFSKNIGLEIDGKACTVECSGTERSILNTLLTTLKAHKAIPWLLYFLKKDYILDEAYQFFARLSNDSTELTTVTFFGSEINAWGDEISLSKLITPERYHPYMWSNEEAEEHAQALLLLYQIFMRQDYGRILSNCGILDSLAKSDIPVQVAMDTSPGAAIALAHQSRIEVTQRLNQIMLQLSHITLLLFGIGIMISILVYFSSR